MAKIKPANTFTLTGALLYYGLLAAMLTLFLSRSNVAFWQGVPLIGSQQLYNNFSNLTLSFILIWAVGATTMLMRPAWNPVLIWAAIMTVGNLVMELAITIGNTPDLLDAATGICGVVLALGATWVFRRVGIRPYVPRKKN